MGKEKSNKSTPSKKDNNLLLTSATKEILAQLLIEMTSNSLHNRNTIPNTPLYSTPPGSAQSYENQISTLISANNNHNLHKRSYQKTPGSPKSAKSRAPHHVPHQNTLSPNVVQQNSLLTINTPLAASNFTPKKRKSNPFPHDKNPPTGAKPTYIHKRQKTSSASSSISNFTTSTPESGVYPSPQSHISSSTSSSSKEQRLHQKNPSQQNSTANITNAITCPTQPDYHNPHNTVFTNRPVHMSLPNDNPNQPSYTIELHHRLSTVTNSKVADVKLASGKSQHKYTVPYVYNSEPKMKHPTPLLINGQTSDGQLTTSNSSRSSTSSSVNFNSSTHYKLVHKSSTTTTADKTLSRNNRISQYKRLRLNLRKNINKNFDFEPMAEKPVKKFIFLEANETRQKLTQIEKRYRQKQEKYVKLYQKEKASSKKSGGGKRK